jgi:hypothetical protein
VSSCSSPHGGGSFIWLVEEMLKIRIVKILSFKTEREFRMTLSFPEKWTRKIKE